MQCLNSLIGYDLETFQFYPINQFRSCCFSYYPLSIKTFLEGKYQIT